jgi:hypothetical protein
VGQKGCFIVLLDKNAFLHCGTKGCFIALWDNKAVLIYCNQKGLFILLRDKKATIVIWDELVLWDEKALGQKVRFSKVGQNSQTILGQNVPGQISVDKMS